MCVKKQKGSQKKQTITPKNTHGLFTNRKFVSRYNLYAKNFDDFKYLLVPTCEIINFVLVIPIKSRATQVIAEALIHS